jgi:Spy/CpxP family protein refolding chaperone
VSESPSRVRPLVRKVLYPVADDLNLSDEQQRRIEQIAINQAIKTEPLMKEMAVNNQRLRLLFVDPSADRDEIIELATRQGEAITNLTILYEEVRLEIFHALTPAQQELLRKHVEGVDSDTAKVFNAMPVDEQ